MDLVTRPLEPDDAVAALELLRADDRRFFGEALLTLPDLESSWSAPGFSFAGDTEAYVEAGVLVAFGTLSARGGIELAVAQDWHGSGLDLALIERWEGEAARRGYPTVHRFVADADTDAVAALESRGYRRHHTEWVLSLPVDAEVASRPLPGGYRLRPMTEADAVGVHALVDETFGEWGYGPRSYDAWRAEVVDRSDVTLEHCRVVTCGGRLVGACVVVDPDGRDPAARPEAWVAQLAVDRGHRRQGLAQRMLAETYIAARTRGVPLAGLSTSSLTGALGLYERLGMVVRHTLHAYRLELGDPTPG